MRLVYQLHAEGRSRPRRRDWSSATDVGAIAILQYKGTGDGGVLCMLAIRGLRIWDTEEEKIG